MKWDGQFEPAAVVPDTSYRLRLVVLGFAVALGAQGFTQLVPAAQISSDAQAHTENGSRLLQSGDLKGAEAELRQAVALDPLNNLGLAGLGAVLGMEHRLEESSLYLERALRLNPNDAATRRNLASNQFQMGQLQLAKANLELLARAKPPDPTVLLLLGMVDEEVGNYDAALKYFADVPALVRQQPMSIAALARAYYHTGQNVNARATLGELEKHPAGPEGIFSGGQVAAQAGDYETAERMFSSIESSYPDAAKLGYSLALAQYRAGRIEESHATLRRLMAAAHNSSDIENLSGWCFFKEGNAKEAVAAMDRAVALDPGSESNYLDVGMILLELGRPSGAFVAAEKAVEVAPQSYRGYRLKGLTELKLAKITDAEKSFVRAQELNPADPESVLGLALAQWDDGKVSAAVGTFEAGLRRFPRDPSIHLEYGRMLLKTMGIGDASIEPRAVELLKRAIALDGSLPEPHHLLGKLALEEGRAQEAVPELETAAQLNPTSSEIHYSLARAYRRLDRSHDAAQEFKTFQRLKAEEDRGSREHAAESDGPAVPTRSLLPSRLYQESRHDE